MNLIQFTNYFKVLLFLIFLLFLIGFLFQNILPSVAALSILVFLIYCKENFKNKVGEITNNREIFEKQIFVNHPVNIKTNIKNHGGELNLKVTDNLPDNSTIVKGSNQINQKIKPDEEISLEYQIKFNSRGRQKFKELKIEISDALNLYKMEFEKPTETIFWVHSNPEEIKKAKRVSQREHIEIVTPSLTGLEIIYEMEGIREFQPGDKLKDIEWKATSRLQKIMTKLFEKKELLDTIVLIDCSYSMRRTTKDKSKIDHATNIAISLTKILQSIRHPIGLIAFDEYKIIKNLKPTNNHNIIFENITDLPGQIKTSNFKIKEAKDPTDVNIDIPSNQQRFISTVFPFLAKGRRKIKNPMQASGIYESMRLLMMDNKTKHIIILTDMETNIQSIYRSITLAHAKKYNIWLLTSFSPYYDIEKDRIETEQLEEIYKTKQIRENILHKIRKLNIEVVELVPSMESVKVIEQIRGKRK